MKRQLIWKDQIENEASRKQGEREGMEMGVLVLLCCDELMRGGRERKDMKL